MPRLRPASLPLVLLAAGCQEPFAVQRKELGPFRVAAVGVVDGVASAAVWSGQGAFHDEAPTLAWSLDGAPLGEGWEVPVGAGEELQLVVTAPDGEAHEARVSVGQAPPTPGVERAAIEPGEDLSLEARRALAATPVEGSAPSGSAVRLALTFPAEADLAGLGTRWMSVADQATLLELEVHTADVLAEELVYEDGELVGREPLPEGRSTHLALVMDGEGGNRWAWLDAAIGLDAPLLRHEGFLLPLDAEVDSAALAATGLVALTLEPTDDAWGLRAVDPAPVDDLSAQQPLACAPAGQPFRWAWIVEGRCPRPAVEGARVVVQAW